MEHSLIPVPKLALVIFLCLWIPSLSDLSAQQGEWEFDRIERRKEEQQKMQDSTLMYYEKRWRVQLTYGRWFFSNGIRSEGDSLFSLGGQMPVWRITGAWHFRERLFGTLSLGFQIERNRPATPDFSSVLNGSDIELEGSGAVIIPVEIGLKYYLTQDRFRPLVGVSIGGVMARSQYTIAEGNIASGITTTDFSNSGRVGFGSINAGFDYRWSTGMTLGVDSAYYLSGTFKEPIGGYSGFQGFVINVGLSILL
jgi:hypothetical protein